MPGRDRYWHPGRGGLPHQGYLRRRQAVGLVDEIAEGALKDQCPGGEGAGGFEGAGVFVAQGVKAGGGERLLVAPDALDFARLTLVIDTRQR